MWPSFLALLSEKGTKKTQGEIQGYGTSMGSIASMLGLVIGGILFEKITTQVFIIGASIFLCIGILMLINRFRESPIKEPSTLAAAGT